MKKIILTGLLTIGFNSCKGQTDKFKIPNNANKDTMEYIKLEDFKKGNYTNERGDFVQQFTGSGNIDYVVNIKSKNSPVTFIKVFYESTKSLKVTGQRFYDFVYGEWKEYSEQGKLIKNTDHDKDYKFSIHDLQKLIMQEYGVDINILSDPNKNELQYRVERKFDPKTKSYLYHVIFSYGYSDEGESSYPLKLVAIDGNTGKILYEKPYNLNLFWGNKIPKSKTSFPQKK